MGHRAGYVNIIGAPNVGKSTLLNALLGERLVIATPKAQTTRHRILGILNGDDHQLVLSDTPGILEPQYPLQASMMKALYASSMRRPLDTNRSVPGARRLMATLFMEQLFRHSVHSPQWVLRVRLPGKTSHGQPKPCSLPR